jgi:TatA/E family protein of Tat protein translocase
MGTLGFQEILMIFVVALLVFGPKKLPELGKSLGKGIREFKKATDELKSSWEDQVKDISEPLNDFKRDIHSMGQDFKSDLYKHLDAEKPVSTPPAVAQAPVAETPLAETPVAETHEPSHPAEHPPAETTVPKEHA